MDTYKIVRFFKNGPKVQVWKPEEIPPALQEKYRTTTHSTQETIDLVNQRYTEFLDRYQVHWISDKTAHISWTDSWGQTINPIH